MHLKRSNIKNFWPIPKKGTKYIALARHNQDSSISLTVVMRDILKLVNRKKELKEALKQKHVLINHKVIFDENYPITLFDILSIPLEKKNYRAVLSEGKKMIFEEVSDKDANTKVFKVMGKKTLPGKVTQINLSDGKNIISKEKIQTGDSVIFNFKENKIVKIIPMEKGKEVFIIKGKHAGNKGKIEDIVERGGKKIAKINSKKGKVNVWVKNLITLE